MSQELFYCPLTFTTACIAVERSNSEFSPFKGSYVPNTNDMHLENNYLNQVINLIFHLHLYEPSVTEDFTDGIINSINFCESTNFFPNLKNIYIFYTNVVIDISRIKSKYNIKKHFVSYYLMRSYLTKDISNYKELSDWKQSNNKCLNLVGEICRKNRFPVLYEFYKNNNLDILDYSLKYNHNLTEPVSNSIETNFEKNKCDWFMGYIRDEIQLNKNDFFDLYRKLERQLPEDPLYEKQTTNWFNMSAYSFPAHWKDCGLVLQGETYYDIPKFLNDSDNLYPIGLRFFSEKTWKPICTKKPFIACTNVDWVNIALKELGFKNFLEYTDYPNFIEMIPGDHKNVRNIASITHLRVLSFLKNKEKYKEEINSDIEHNYNLWNKLAIESWNELLTMCPALKELSNIEVGNLFIMGQYNRFTFKNLTCKTNP